MFKRKKEEVGDYIEASNLHILIFDSQWLRYFTRDNKSEEVKRTEAELKGLLKEQGNLNAEIKRYSAGKDKMLKKMLKQSSVVRKKGSDALKEDLLKKKDDIEMVRESLWEMKRRAEEIPDEIAQVNNRLFQFSIKQAYNDVGKKIDEVKKYEKEINKLREKISEQTRKSGKNENDFRTNREIDKLREKISEHSEKMERLEEGYNASIDFLIDFIGEEGIEHLDSKYNGRI